MPALIAEVEEDSVAARCGIEAGDVLGEINGVRPRDILDYHLLCDETNLEIALERDGRELAFLHL